ncbi:ligand-effect modulator 3 family [Paecilomyces variotii]|uniref:Ligand-effect modulator 3 family n=1 Tax=Byssochlamys spectabilis TaxID=264951 RepID=A0A443HTF8_BYSSP|nr:ligand-effect modulator 3 family [Paecilomyces variotii]KAJ9268032.1 hypothetical protein DTO195F2_366 [Paecilomyces variotii]KAJ9358515.1 hypothetical protein DTO280E4_5071 [Paecilomyces variotii]KAJ9373489.1 hypothetical protein DTO282E5_1940 [Paecilomyces variotii]RWQ95101.1 ligand-effect modulator 3 family [Paecilomyces variotii]
MSRTELDRPESVEEQDPHRADGDKKQKSKRPANTAFRQQRLKAWQPILTPRSVLPLFFVIGTIFAPLGGVLLWASSQVQEIVIDYSDCKTQAPVGTFSPIPDKVTATFKSTQQTQTPSWQRTMVQRPILKNQTTVCSLLFEIPNDLPPPVFLYYRLTNFYQNHRRYVQSLDLDQLMGKPLSNSTIAGSTCDPLTTDPATGKAYYPCGLIANSIFNDTIYSPALVGVDAGNITYEMTNKGIAWDSDKQIYKKTQYQNSQVHPPPNWHDRYPNGYNDETPIPNINEDEELMVWMRTAGLPSFSKLSRRNDTTPMKAGVYRLDIDDYFPVTEYSGTKSILISTRTVMGGRNPFMGIAYVVVGGICIVLGALFTVAHLVKPRKMGDHTYLTWNNDQHATAVTTGRDDRFGSHAL